MVKEFARHGSRMTKGKSQNGESDNAEKENIPKGWSGTELNKQEIKTRSVIFVDGSPKGSLGRNIREVQKRLNTILGYNTKVVECVGKKLKDLLPNTDPWSGQPCGRQSCIPCGQNGDVKQNCRKRNVIYESKCEICNPNEEDKKKSSSLKDGRENPSIYVGETARSISERASEHWADYRSGAEESHILKHWKSHHAGVGEPKFRFKVVKFCRDALTRQVWEATGIFLRGITLNSKSGYNMIGIAKLTLNAESVHTEHNETITSLVAT